MEGPEWLDDLPASDKYAIESCVTSIASNGNDLMAVLKKHRLDHFTLVNSEKNVVIEIRRYTDAELLARSGIYIN